MAYLSPSFGAFYFVLEEINGVKVCFFTLAVI